MTPDEYANTEIKLGDYNNSFNFLVHGFDRSTGKFVDLLDNDYVSVVAYKYNSETSKYTTSEALKFRPCTYEEISRISQSDA